MVKHELFAREERTIANAEKMLGAGHFQAEQERHAYVALLEEYQKLFRTTRRLMRLSDHNERELSAMAEKQRLGAQEISRKNRELEALSAKLAKYLSPQVFESIFSGRQDVKIASRRKKLTIFFSDLAGFTETADKMESEDLTQLLNQYLTEMSRVAIRFGATIDKYVGDAIMIFFGDPESRGVKEDALACVRMALAMQEKMAELRQAWRDAGIETPLACRIGIHTAYCTVGNFGSEDRMDYTIIGGGVNLASRLEKSAPAGGITISYETHAHVKDEVHCEEAGQVKVKGFTYPVASYRVVDLYRNLGQEPELNLATPHLRLHVEPGPMSKEERALAAGALREALARLEPSKITDQSGVLLCGVRPEVECVIRRAASQVGHPVFSERDLARATERISMLKPAVVVLDSQAAWKDDVSMEFLIQLADTDPDTGIMIVGEEDQLRPCGRYDVNSLAWPFSDHYAAAKLQATLMGRKCRWLKAPVPADESVRLQEFRTLRVSGTGTDARLDLITRIAHTALNVPIAAVSLIDEQRQLFRSCVGLDIRETPREAAFCAHAILNAEPLVVSDALLDERFADNPLVRGEPHIRFYAGHPIRSLRNVALGTLCVIDTKPREFTGEQTCLLGNLARLVEREMLVN